MKVEENNVQSCDVYGQRKDKEESSSEDGQISSAKERWFCKENVLEEANAMHKRGRYDKKENSEDTWEDAEVRLNAHLDDGQISSGNKGEAFLENRLEEEASPLIDNLEAEDSMFEEGVCGTGLTDAEEWNDDQSDIVGENVRSPKSKNRKLSSGSSSSSTMDFGPSKFRKRQTKHQSKQRTVLVSSDEEEHSPERF